VSRRAVVCFAAMAFAFAFLAPWTGEFWNGSNQGSHYSLVKALSEGTPYVDRTRPIVGSGTLDLGSWHGHLVSDKAPGFALFVLPGYEVLRAVGIHDATSEMRWALGLWAAVLPALLLLLLMRRVADRLVPGQGLATAVTFGLGTIMLPFASIFFAHAVAALFCFAAFAVLFAERGTDRTGLVAVGGLLAGLAVTVEYPNAVAVLLLGGYALFERHSVKRVGAYAAGAFAGVLPLLAYDWWAFDSPWRYSRSRDVLVLPFNHYDTGIGGLGAPTVDGLRRLLLDLHQGLFPTAPVLVCAIVGVALLIRSSHRAEGILIAAMAAAYVVYNAGYPQVFGGSAPGPRYIVAMMPLLALGLAASYLRFPRITAVVGALSIARMAAVTATSALAVPDHGEVRRFLHRDFVGTVLDALRIWTYPHPVVKIWPFVVAVGIASVAALWPYVRGRT